MQVSLNIILDALHPYRLEKHVPKDSQLSYSMCLPLPDEIVTTHHNFIYIGSLTKALAFCSKTEGFNCICLRDRIKDDAENDDVLSGLIIINENITLSQLFTQIQTRFFTIIDWVQKMQQAMIHDGSMQDILDLAEPILDNHISVSDSALMLMAYTRHIYCDDPICIALAEYGYHPEETIQKFRKYALFNIWETADGVYVDETCEVAKYVTLHKVFKFGNLYFAHVVMSCNQNPLTPCLTDLYQIFIDVLAVYIERAWETKNTCTHVYDSFLTDLIDGNITSKSVIEERAHYVGIPVKGQFCLFQVIATDTVNMSIGKMLIEFADLFPRFKFIRYQQQIVAVHHFDSRDVDRQLEVICNLLDNFLLKYESLCGVSLFFASLDEIPFAFKQSSLALKFVNGLNGSVIFKNIQQANQKQSRLHFFRQKYLFCLLGENTANAELWYHSEYHSLLKTLYQYDQRHKGNNMQLLHVFLNVERNATEAASSLNMHRNNVTYHVNRIQEILNIDFDDPTVRFMMLLSYSLLELYGFSDG